MAISFIKRSYGSKRMLLLICIFATAIIWSGCHRKIGVKPGGQLKTDTSKCKCKKKKGGIYSQNSNVLTTFNLDFLIVIDNSKFIA